MNEHPRPYLEREASADGHLIPIGPERLPEPELSLYLSLWGQYHASQLQTTALAQALQAQMAVISRRHGFTDQQTIDAEGYIHQQTPAERSDGPDLRTPTGDPIG